MTEEIVWMMVSRPPANARLANPIISSRVSARPRKVAFVRALKKSSPGIDRKSTRLNSSHLVIWYAVFCFKKHHILQQADTGELRPRARTDPLGGIKLV